MPVELTHKTLAQIIDYVLESECPRKLWNEGDAEAPPPTASTLVAERQKLVRWLNRKGKLLSRPAARAIAARMAQCKPLQRCLSGACPECSSGLQRALVEASNAHRWERGKEGPKSKVITLVAKGCRFDSSKLQEDPVGAATSTGVLVDRLVKAIRHHLGIVMVGAIDLSFNVDTRLKYELCFLPAFKSHWRPHLQVHLSADLWDEIEEDVREEFTRADQIPKPVVAKDLDLNPQADAYLIKRLWEPGHRGRRETYVNRKISTLFPQAETRTAKLRVHERLDQLIFLNELGLSRRLVLIGCRLKMTPKGPRIRPIK